MPEPTQTETVSKTEFEQVRTRADEATRNLESLKSQLLEPDYLDYLQSKRDGRVKPADVPAARPTSLQNLSLEQLQQMIAQGVAHSVQEVLKPIHQRLNDVQIRQEVDEVRAKYDDFDTYKEAIVEILNSAPNDLNTEQAYLLAVAKAKQSGGNEETPTEPTEKAPGKGNERPSSSVPVDGDTIKTFKTEKDAGSAAWSEVAARHGLTTDKI